MNTTDLTPIPAYADPELFKKQAKELRKSFKAEEPSGIARVEKFHPDFKGGSKKELSLAEARLTVAREHGFFNWTGLLKHIRELSDGDSDVSKFEKCADAIVTGDAGTLKKLIRYNPKLIRMRSPRVHRAMLIHYTSANGFENYRQKTPENAVDILNILLDAGADINAVGDMYGGTNTLGLTATSVHPVVAGVQKQLIDVLLEHGASFDNAVAPDYTRGNLVNACLANGRGEAAEYLASKGAPLDLEGSAGLGRLEMVEAFFDHEGKLAKGATQKQMEAGFGWACQYGRHEVVEFLIKRGVDINAGEDTDMTALHMAVLGGHVNVIKLLLQHNANLEARNRYNGTPLGQAVWCVVNQQNGPEYATVLETLIEAGAKYENNWVDWLERQETVSAELKRRVLELFRTK